MKKVINGRSYNTETAKELGYQTNGYANNVGGDEEFFEIFSKTQKLAQFPCFDEDEYNRITEHLQSEKVLMVFKKEKPVAVLLSLEEYQNRSE